MRTDRDKERLEQIRAAGQHLIDNAETILGDEKFRVDLTIEVVFPCHALPTITVHRSVIPDGVVEKLEMA